MKMTTLCYIEKDNNYLMLHRTKKEKDINKGKWIGVGGHAEGCETPEECLLREVKEETGLTLTAYRFRGLITFISDEGDLCWVSKDKILELPTWEGDAVFLKLLLSDEQRFFTIKLRYEGDKLIEKNVQFY